MKTLLVAAALLVFVAEARPDWKSIAPGVDYQEWIGKGRAIYVTRVDLRNTAIRLTATPEKDRATTVSEYARRNNALVAINADFFDEKRKPIGLSVGPCGPWKGTADTEREAVFYSDGGRGRIQPSKEVLTDLTGLEAAVSGWPILITGCEALTSEELPGSDAFTRKPHPRTALGLSRDRRRLYLVVADGRREGVPGLTLAELGEFMDETLDVCSGLNLDGGGSTAMWVAGCVVNVPSDKRERVVANHIGIVLVEDFVSCESNAVSPPSYAAECPRTRPEQAPLTSTSVAAPRH